MLSHPIFSFLTTNGIECHLHFNRGIGPSLPGPWGREPTIIMMLCCLICNYGRYQKQHVEGTADLHSKELYMLRLVHCLLWPFCLNLYFLSHQLVINVSGELLYESAGVRYYKVPVPHGTSLVTGAVADTCEENGMKAVCNGESLASCSYTSARCRVTPLSAVCGDQMYTLSKLICNGTQPDQCPQMEGMFADMRDWHGSECGAVGGQWCVQGKTFMSSAGTPAYAYCAL